MKKFTKFVTVLLVVAMFATMLASCGSSSYTAKNTTFKIGMSGPLSGGAAIYGIAVQNGAKMAIEEINAQGGLNGVKFELLSYDDTHDSTKVASGYATMLESGMQVSIGCVTSAPCAEFKALSKEDHVFFITPSASNDAIPNGDNGYQMCFADGNQGKAAAEYVNEAYAGQTIGILYKAGDNYSQGIYEQFIANLTNVTTTVASFTGDDTVDFSTQAGLLKDVEFVFMPIYYDPAYLFMKEMAKSEYSTKNKVYYGCDGFDGIDAIENADFSNIKAEVSMLSHFNAKSTETATSTFVTKYTEKYGEKPIQFGAAAYDCVWAIYNAMKKAINEGTSIDVTISASDLCDILKAQFNGNFTYSGVTGNNMTWDANGYVNKTAQKFVVFEAKTEKDK